MIILISQNEDEDFDNEDGDDDIDYQLVIVEEVMVLTSEGSKIDQCNDKKDPEGR